jgi:hypothetical protein
LMEISCTPICKLKDETCWNYSMNRGMAGKGEWMMEGEFNYDIL